MKTREYQTKEQIEKRRAAIEDEIEDHEHEISCLERELEELDDAEKELKSDHNEQFRERIESLSSLPSLTGCERDSVERFTVDGMKTVFDERRLKEIELNHASEIYTPYPRLA